jgi:hypothetical protein
MHSQGGDFFILHPDPPQLFDPPGFDPEAVEEADHGLLQLPDITGNARPWMRRFRIG